MLNERRETWNDRVQVFVERRNSGPPHPYTRGGFMMLSIDGVRELDQRLGDHTLGMQAVRVLVAMTMSADFENRVRMGQKDLCSHLGMSSGNVSQAITSLVQCGFVQRPETSRGYYRINPRLMWKGSVKGLKQALAA